VREGRSFLREESRGFVLVLRMASEIADSIES
jgi:hypothetical protein